MLIEFSVGNYKSFGETVTFSMVAAKISSQDKNVDVNNTIRVNDDLMLLKSAAVYGANASGKSNLISAFAFMQNFISDSSKGQSTDSIDVEPFRLNLEWSQKPSFFEIVFLLNGKRYRYGFEANKDRIVSEWLFCVRSTKEVRLFERDFGVFKISKEFKEGKGLEVKTRDNALFLSVVAQFNGKILNQIIGATHMPSFNVISGLDNVIPAFITGLIFLSAETVRKEILNLVKALDLSIDDVEIDENVLSNDELALLPVGTQQMMRDHNLKLPAKVKTLHKIYNPKTNTVSLARFDLYKDESEGTKKLFAFAGIFTAILAFGGVLVIDEFDTKLHPLISKTLVKLFNSCETNRNNAQLIFATHDTNLLDKKLFRRDQIWFTEKDQTSQTRLYSLVEYHVRNTAAYESDYIQGRYGAIPFIGDLTRLFGDQNGKEEQA